MGGNQKTRQTQTHNHYIVKLTNFHKQTNVPEENGRGPKENTNSNSQRLYSQTNKLPETDKQAQSTRGAWEGAEGTKRKDQLKPTETIQSNVVKLTNFHKQTGKPKVPEENGREPNTKDKLKLAETI